jgi:hypothetical protein
MNKKTTLRLLLALLVAPTFASAGNNPTWKDKCSNLRACVDAYSELTGDQFIYDKDVNGTVIISDNLPFVKEDAELIFTNILYQNYLSRVLIKPGVYNILRSNDAKGKALPLITCDQNTPPKLPNTYDLVTLEYKFTNGIMAKGAENVIRTYVDMGARIYGIEYPGILYITDVAKQMPKAYAMLKELDVKPTKEYLEEKKKWDEARMKEVANGGGNRNGNNHKNGDDKKKELPAPSPKKE